MFKAIILLKKKEDVTPEQFKDWWINSHSPKAAKLTLLKMKVKKLLTVSLNNGLIVKKILRMLMLVKLVKWLLEIQLAMF